MALISNLKTPDDQTFDIRAGAIPFGEVDSTSTATAFTATVPGITALVDGTTVMLRNGVVTSASGFTININGLGAKPCYSNMATGNDVTPTNPTRDTTIFNINYTMMFVYQSDLVSGGAWICYRGYDANTNTIGYQLRTNSTVMNVSDTARYYKMYFMSADNTKWVPASVNSTNNATSARPVNQRPINPFGRIVYTSSNTNYAAGANLAATTIWDQYVFNLGYSFNRTGAALTMTVEKPVYLKCAPQTDGSAIMDATEPIVQALPTTEDEKIYIYLGVAYSATNIELYKEHPVYHYKNGKIRLYTNESVSSVNGKYGIVTLTAEDVGALDKSTQKLVVNDSSGQTSYPIITYYKNTVNGISGLTMHIDDGSTDGQFIFWPDINGFTTASQAFQPTLVSGTNIKTVGGNSLLGSGDIPLPTVPSASTTTPSMDGTASYGSGTTWARADHVHPHDTSKVDKETIDGYRTSTFGTAARHIAPYMQTEDSESESGASISVDANGSNSQAYIYVWDDQNGNENEVIITPTSTTITNIITPTNDTDAANKKYVDDSVPTKTSDLTNDSGYLTLSTLPIYDGTVV